MAKVGDTFGGGVFSTTGFVSNLQSDKTTNDTYTFGLVDSEGIGISHLTERILTMTRSGMESRDKLITFNQPITFRFTDPSGLLQEGKLAVVSVSSEEVQRVCTSKVASSPIQVSSIL